MTFQFKGRVPMGHPSNKWSNQCEYECLLCVDKRYKTFSNSGFGGHIKGRVYF